MGWALSLAGWLPFAALALSLLVLEPGDPWYPLAVQATATYGAVILSFLGGTRWGFALQVRNEEDAPRTLLFSVLPSLAGWFSLLAPVPYVFAIQALAFAGQGAWDAFTGPAAGFPQWFSKLRVWLTLLVAGALVVAFFATVGHRA